MANTYLPRQDVLYRGNQSRLVQGYTTRSFENPDRALLQGEVNVFLETLPSTISGDYVPHVVSTQFYTAGAGANEVHVCWITLYLTGSLTP